jgi:hypothetical protein
MSPSDDAKALSTLSAMYALQGFELIAETGIDGATHLYAVCRGTGEHLDSLDEARAHLERVR